MSEHNPTGIPVAILHHVISNQYMDLRPTGYLFAIVEKFVRIIYYHDEPRIIAETISENSQPIYQVMPTRVQDVAVTMTIDDFVNLMARNLRDIKVSYPEILESAGVRLETPGV